MCPSLARTGLRVQQGRVQSLAHHHSASAFKSHVVDRKVWTRNHKSQLAYSQDINKTMSAADKYAKLPKVKRRNGERERVYL